MKMKTKIKKLVCLMLSAMMVLAMSLTGYADEGDNNAEGQTQSSGLTITIKNETTGHTYQAYQVFPGTLENGALVKISGWGTGVDGDSLLIDLKNETKFKTKGLIAELGNASGASAVADALSKINDQTLEGKADAKLLAQIIGKHTTGTSVSSSYDTENKKYTITDLSMGYYFVKDADTTLNDKNDAYTGFILKLVDNVAVSPKTALPTVEKKVEENVKYREDAGYGDGYNDVADWSIGDHVPFKLIGKLPSNYEDYDKYTYEFHDTMSSGLTYDGDTSLAVYVDSISDENKIIPTSIQSSVNPDTKETSLTISFEDLTKVKTANNSSIDKASTIIVTYTATLNKSAVIGLNGNPNEVYLTYSNNPNASGNGDTEPTGKTETDKVIVFTYELDVTKVKKGTDEILKNAKFLLYKEDNEKVKYYAVLDKSTDTVKRWEALDSNISTIAALVAKYDTNEDNEDEKVLLVSDDDGLFKAIGLDDGEYYLNEYEAPSGYNILTTDVKFTITADTNNTQSWTDGDAEKALIGLTIDSKEDSGDLDTGTVSMTVENGKGATLPSTGGIGTTIFYIIGGLMMLGAAIVLITKKRVADND